MPTASQVLRSLRRALKGETRAEFEERYLAQAVDAQDFEARVRHLLAIRAGRRRPVRGVVLAPTPG